jgi:hypothetical protein
MSQEDERGGLLKLHFKDGPAFIVPFFYLLAQFNPAQSVEPITW